jgi:16S rRNA (uracil1498-N3)-methyltransferase
MGAPVFALPTALLLAGDELVLDGAEGRHAAAVRRVRTGEAVVVTDGAGHAAATEVTSADPTGLRLAVISRWEEPERQPRIVVVQALPKGDRGELAVETLTEVGVDVIVPWAAERCITRWRDDRAVKGLNRWRSTAREAAKQSRRVRWPEVRPLATTEDVTALLAGADLAVVLHEEAVTPLASVTVPLGGDVVLVVGPEGGISDGELEAFAYAQHVRLGPSVLRTSTAGTVAAGIVLAATARWQSTG